MGDKIEGIVAKCDERYGIFTEEALQAQDGQKVPLTLDGGEVIGEMTLSYDADQKALMASIEVEDSKMEELLMGPMPFAPTSIKFKTKDN